MEHGLIFVLLSFVKYTEINQTYKKRHQNIVVLCKSNNNNHSFGSDIVTLFIVLSTFLQDINLAEKQ